MIRGMGSRRLSSVIVSNPYSGQMVCEVPCLERSEVFEQLDKAEVVQKEWSTTPLEDRIVLCHKLLDVLEDDRDALAIEITMQMGKPLAQARGEISGVQERIRGMADLAPVALATQTLPNKSGLFRKITQEPIGVSLAIAPWNYPLLTAINAILPSVLAGNAVLLKHSPRTPLCGDAYERIFDKAGFPTGLVQSILCSHEITADLIHSSRISAVSFTGSVQAGREVSQTVSRVQGRFVDSTFELGGKDAAYIAPDAHLQDAVDGVFDGAFYNAGQSCCGIERVYVHESLYDQFVAMASERVAEEWVMGDPMDPETTLGPMALEDAPAFLQSQVHDAKTHGARLVCGGRAVHDDKGNGRFFAPTVVADCSHETQLMRKESFGPVIGVASVSSDAAAVERINDCEYGLTNAIYTTDKDRALRMASKLHCGTVFMNRCDYLDPYLPWSGVKNSGRGVSLSTAGFHLFTRHKGYNFRL